MKFLLCVLVLGFSLIAFADYAEDVQLVPTNNLLVRGKMGKELEKVLGNLSVEELLATRESYKRYTYTLSADSSLRPSLHFWINYIENLGDVSGLDDRKLETLDLVIAQNPKGHFIISGPVAEGIHKGIARAKNDHFVCQKKELGASRTYPGFFRTICLIQP